MRTLYNAVTIVALLLLGYGVLENQRHNGILLGIAAKHEALILKQANDMQRELNIKHQTNNNDNVRHKYSKTR